MKQTKYGYICREEAMIDGHLDRWLKQKQKEKRCPKRRRFLYANRTQTWRADNAITKERKRSRS